jgi:hypothetical protein
VAALTDYARLALFVDQTYAVQITSLEWVTNSGLQRVDLLNDGLAGFTPGAGDTEINIGFAVPIGGMEYDWQGKCANKEFVTLQLIQADKQYVGTGKLMSVRGAQSVNANLEGSASWIGPLKPFQ